MLKVNACQPRAGCRAGFQAESVVGERGAACAAAAGSATGCCGFLSPSPIPTPGAGCALSSATQQLGCLCAQPCFHPISPDRWKLGPCQSPPNIQSTGPQRDSMTQARHKVFTVQFLLVLIFFNISLDLVGLFPLVGTVHGFWEWLAYKKR